MQSMVTDYNFLVQSSKYENDHATLKVFCPNETLYAHSSMGIGIAGSLPKKTLESLTARLVIDKGDIRNCSDKCLIPCRENDHKSPDYAAPRNAFLTCLLNQAIPKAVATAADLKSELFKNTACLYYVMMCDHEGEDIKQILKDNYSVLDLIDIFPNVVSAKNIVDLQRQENGSRTYSIYDVDQNLKTFSINVKKQKDIAFRACFGEPVQARHGMKYGQCSNYLCSLEPKDIISVKSIKQGPRLPLKEILNGRDILLILQGNAVSRGLSILSEIAQRKNGGEVFGKVVVVCSASYGKNLVETDKILEFLSTDIITKLHLCLSRETGEVDLPNIQESDKIKHHLGCRISSGIVSEIPVKNPFVLSVGDQNFTGETTKDITESVFQYDFVGAHELRNNAEEPHADLRISSSTKRNGHLQGVPHCPVDVEKAIQAFTSSSVFWSTVNKIDLSLYENAPYEMKRSLSSSELGMREL